MTAKRELRVGDVVEYDGKRGVVFAIRSKRARKGGERKEDYQDWKNGCLLKIEFGGVGYHAPASEGPIWWVLLDKVKLV